MVSYVAILDVTDTRFCQRVTKALENMDRQRRRRAERDSAKEKTHEAAATLLHELWRGGKKRVVTGKDLYFRDRKDVVQEERERRLREDHVDKNHHSLHHTVIKQDLYKMLDTDTKEGYEAQALELLKLPDEAVVTKETIARSGPFVSLSMFF